MSSASRAKKASIPDLAGEKVLDSIAKPAIAIRGFLVSFLDEAELQPNNKIVNNTKGSEFLKRGFIRFFFKYTELSRTYLGYNFLMKTDLYTYLKINSTLDR